jgi:3-demethoxyubiquinol 3-hydroxylase
MRRLSALDRWVHRFDSGLRAASGVAPRPNRPNPAAQVPEARLEPEEMDRVARLIRVDHAGEVAAQALYEGQAWSARSDEQASAMRCAAAQESDHLAWCTERLQELGAKPSALGPFWYLGSFAMGAAAGTVSDRFSLGFLAETEHQVERHLDEHLEQLPVNDLRSRAILTQMKADEAAHAQDARDQGGQSLPLPVRHAMRLVSRVMTHGAQWI